MWALELWEMDAPDDLAVLAMPIVDLDGNTRVEHGKDGMIVRTRGDCDHFLHALPDRVAYVACAAQILLYCSTCERAIELHVSEVPPCMIHRIDRLLDDVDWSQATN